MIDIEKEAKEIEESQPGKEEVDEDIKPAELEGNQIRADECRETRNNSWAAFSSITYKMTLFAPQYVE